MFRVSVYQYSASYLWWVVCPVGATTYWCEKSFITLPILLLFKPNLVPRCALCPYNECQIYWQSKCMFMLYGSFFASVWKQEKEEKKQRKWATSWRLVSQEWLAWFTSGMCSLLIRIDDQGKTITSKNKRSDIVTLLEALDIEGVKKKVVLIKGDPGMGKTTLTIIICKCWAESSLLQSYKAVVLLTLRAWPWNTRG